MKILMITQWFNPEPNLKGLSFAKELIKCGHEVQVLTGFPNYPEGKIYDGYKLSILKKEIIDGVEIFRVPLYPNHDNSGFKRALNYLSFGLSSSIIGLFVVKKPDIIYSYHPPGTVIIPTIIFTTIFRVPYVLDVQDMWPETVAVSGMLSSKIIIKIIGYMCKIMYKCAKRIIVLSPGFKDNLVKKDVNSKKIEVIYNWCDEISYNSDEELSVFDKNIYHKLSNKFNFIYAGVMGKAQSLSTILHTASLLKNRLTKLQFVLVGGGVELEQLKDKALKMNLNNVIFIKRQPVSYIKNILEFADVLLVHLKDDPLFRITIPSKTQFYMKTGKPILMAVKGNAGELIKKSNCGFVCQPDDPIDISKAVEKFYFMKPKELNNLGSNAYKYYVDNLSMKKGVKKMINVFENVLKIQ